MTDHEERKQPLDHLPAQDERDGAAPADQPQYPGVGTPEDGSSVTPATAAEPSEARRHGVDKLPPSGR